EVGRGAGDRPRVRRDAEGRAAEQVTVAVMLDELQLATGRTGRQPERLDEVLEVLTRVAGDVAEAERAEQRRAGRLQVEQRGEVEGELEERLARADRVVEPGRVRAQRRDDPGVSGGVPDRLGSKRDDAVALVIQPESHVTVRPDRRVRRRVG